MAYTAAISCLIQGSPKPIVLTGAQTPIGFDCADSKINLTDALRCAAEDLPGVSIAFNNQVLRHACAQNQVHAQVAALIRRLGGQHDVLAQNA